MACIPTVLPGANPFAQDKSHFDVNKPLFNASAFQPANIFNFYGGAGPRISNIRSFGYHNEDLGLTKKTQITEKISLQIRAEAFNIWNWHIFTASNQNGFNPVNTDVSSPSFGMWGGAVSAPRNIQLGAKVVFCAAFGVLEASNSVM